LRDEALFGDKKTHSFVLDSNGQYNSGAPLRVSTDDFLTTTERFYLKANGWDSYIPFTGIGYEFSYSISFNGGGGGVLAGIREPLEPCNACLTHSFAKAASSLLVNEDLSMALDVTTVAEVEAILGFLLDFVSTLPGYPTEWRNLYFGVDDGTYYGIYNCEYPDYVAICDAAGPNVQYFANIKNTVVPGLSTDGRRDRRVIDANGKIGAVMDASTSVFDTVNRPWYLQQNGWTAPFTGATAGTSTRGFASAFKGGVIVSDTGAPCEEPVYDCPDCEVCEEPEPCPEPEEPILDCSASSLGATMVALLVALVSSVNSS
jgi:hypothetical protein